MTDRRALLGDALALVEAWEERWGPYARAAVPDVDWTAFAARLGESYPFFHPRYAGQMLKPPHPVASAAYLAAMLINPNNHALDGGPATSAMEEEAVADLAAMLGLAEPSLGHLTSSGTIANLEALWVARELSGGAAVVHSAEAHYTHARMCGVLGVEARAVPADARGRIDLAAVEAEIARGGVGTVVLTAGTTGLGAVDPIDEALALRERYGVRLHVDAAYGGFFALLAGTGLVPDGPLRAIGACDSVVVDPHKHGLQPYGCGAVLFADPGVGRLYRHDSPYTYFTSGELHLGEISLECSRAGAAAAALWMTLRTLGTDGLADGLAASRRAALGWAALLRESELLELHADPELDIVCWHAAADALSAIDASSAAVLAAGMEDPEDPLFLSTLRRPADAFGAGVRRDADGARVLRSVLMKPEHEAAVAWLHGRATDLVGAVA